MKKNFLENQKELLLKMKKDIMTGLQLKAHDELHIKSEDLADEGDLASNVIDQNVAFNLREKELKKLRDIEAALGRIENGTYGCCFECDEEINNKRLEKQPTAELCIIHAEERERDAGFKAS